MDSVGRQKKSNPNDIQFDGDATFHAEIYVTNAWRLATTVMVRAAWHGIKPSRHGVRAEHILKGC